MTDTQLSNALYVQVHAYLKENRLADDRAEETLVPVHDARLGLCNVPKAVHGINKLLRSCAPYECYLRDSAGNTLSVSDVRKVGLVSWAVVIPSTVGLDSLL